MVARGAGRVDALSPVQRERVKPERHRGESRASEDRVDLDRQQVSHLPLSLRHDEPLPRASGPGFLVVSRVEKRDGLCSPESGVHA